MSKEKKELMGVVARAMFRLEELEKLAMDSIDREEAWELIKRIETVQKWMAANK